MVAKRADRHGIVLELPEIVEPTTAASFEATRRLTQNTFGGFEAGAARVDKQSMTSEPLLPDDPGGPFPRSGLDTLLAAAAADRPDQILLLDDSGLLSAAVVARRMKALASALLDSGLEPGDRLLVVAGAEAASVVALAGALDAGLEPALVACGFGPAELAAHARAAGAVAILGPSSYGGLNCADTYLSVAAIVDTIRLVATQGPDPVDGAIDVSPTALDAVPVSPRGTRNREAPLIGTFHGPIGAPSLVLHRQAALFADALSLVEHARVNPSKRILSTLPPATMAGLVAGPFAALVGASSLALHGPFESRRFLAMCDASDGPHVVAPVAMGPAFDDLRLSGSLASLVLVGRFGDPADFMLPPALSCDRPMVDLYAFGEDTLLARRRTDGEAHPPARVTDRSHDGGLGARLNRARADHR